MKRIVMALGLVGLLVLAASSAFATDQPVKGTEGPDVRYRVEPKGTEGPDVRLVARVAPKGTEGPDVRDTLPPVSIEGPGGR